MKKKIISLFVILLLISFQKISLSQDLTPEQIYEKVNDCVVVILSYDFDGKISKQGSGVVISDKGWVVTNYHVFAECEKMEVKHNDKIVKYTDIIGVDVEKDILILKIEDYTFPSILLGSSENLKVGQRIYAIGSPLGLENSMSEGIISGLRNVDERNRNYIQITASISSGSSGGAVINSKGELIGISTMTLKGGQNLNFAIPINDIMLITLGSFSDEKSINANNNFYKGYNADESGNYEEAIKYYTKVLEVFPNNAIVYYDRGITYSNLKNYSKAISDYTKAIEINPNDVDVYVSRGYAYVGLQKYDEAILDFNKALSINPNDVDALINRGSTYSILENYDEAISDYTKAINIESENFGAYWGRGKAYIMLGNYKQAISDCSKSIEINPNNSMSYYFRGLAYYGLRDYSKAILDFNKAIEINPNFAEAYQYRGFAYYYLKEYSKSISDYTKAIEIVPNDAATYYARGYAYYESRNERKACEDWRKAYSLGYLDAQDLLNNYCK